MSPTLPFTDPSSSPLLLSLTLLFISIIIRPLATSLLSPNPLRKYPSQNPFSALTDFALIWERTAPFRTKSLYTQHQTHPILRLGPTSLSFADVRAIRDIYGHTTQCVKGDQYAVQISGHASLLDVVDRGEHARKRRMLANAFAIRNLEQWEFKVSDKVRRLVDQLDRLCSLPLVEGQQPAPEDLSVNWRKWSNLFTVDAIADIGLSEKLDMLDRGNDLIAFETSGGRVRNVGFVESLHGGNRASSILVWPAEWFQVLKMLSKVFSRYFREQWQHGANFGAIVSHLVDRRIQRQDRGDDLDDFVSCLLHDKMGEPRKLDRGEIEAEVGVMMNAGSDTTAIALTNVLFYLIKHPAVLCKLRNEVAAALTEDDIIAPYEKVKNLPYLKACLDESLRLSPPVSFGLVRKTPSGGTRIADEFIPGNITVSVSAYVAHRDPDIFPDPEIYRPERWIEDEEKAKRARNYFIPFSTGARGCIGRNISYLEQNVLIATLVQRYDFALPTEDWELEFEEAFNLWPGQMPLNIWRRT